MKVSDGLGLSAMLSSTDVLNRFQRNMNNQDSLFSIVSELYRETDVSLKENKQNSSAALILTGGWIEGLYIATRLAKATPNKNLTSRIAELKLSLNSLLGTLEELKGNNTYTPLITSLEGLKSTYDQVALSYKEKAAVTNEAAKTTTLTDQISELRATLVATN
jgi:hypothetical protein